MSFILELKNVTKQFPGVKALNNMQISLEEGEVHAVVGENGAGKSTLMKIITGVYHLDEGEMFLRGEKVIFNDPEEAYAKGIAIIYQETNLFPDMTVLENLFLGHEPTKKILGLFKSIDYKKMRKKADEIFSKLGMSVDFNITVDKLGVATKQMVEIAKALTYDASIFIFDEPTAALSNREVKALFDTISRLKSKNVSILYISHRLEEVFMIADCVTVIRDGIFVATARTKDVNNAQLISWMVGRSIDNLYPKTDVKIGAPVLELKDVCQKGVLDNINITIKKGEIVGIAGLAGSGRTELALSIVGLTKNDSGSIIFNGKKVKIKNYHDALERGIAYVSEDRKEKGLIIDMSVKENISMTVLGRLSKLGFINTTKEEKLANKYMKKLSIKTPNSNFITKKLSGGNQQKLSVAKTLAAEPKLLILDEPTRGIDVGSKFEIHQIMNELVNEGFSIILISSDLPEIIGMSDRVYVIKKGSIVGELGRKEVSQEKIIERAL